MYNALFQQMSKGLRQALTWLDNAVAHAEAKKFDPNLYLQFRLAPDQLPFVRQIQIMCDTPKLAAARLAGKEPPKTDDNETTIDELRARIRFTLGYLEGFGAKELEGSSTRTISTPRWGEKTMTGERYFLEHAVPNFYFHLAHAYAILRHNGVNLGKADYLGPLTFTAPA